jgi:hypothetical protein
LGSSISINDGTNTGRVSFVTGLNSSWNRSLWMLWFSLSESKYGECFKKQMLTIAAI